MTNPGNVYRAVADPTRRAILDRLSRGESTVTELLEQFSMSQPALSQHLRVLISAKLVQFRQDGRHRYYRLRSEPLREIYDWLSHYHRFWDEKLDALGQYLEAAAEDRE